MNKIDFNKSEYLWRLRNIFWQLIILALISCCTCCSFMRTFNDFHPQSENGWNTIVHPVHSSSDITSYLSQYDSPAITVSIHDDNGYFFFGPTFFFPIFPFPNSPDSYTLRLEFDNREDVLEIDIRGLKIKRSNGETVHYDAAFYCNAPVKLKCDCTQNDIHMISSGIVTLSKGIYIFKLKFPGSMSAGTSIIDFSDISFSHKKNQLPPLLINNKTRIRYCPLNPVCFNF